MFSGTSVQVVGNTIFGSVVQNGPCLQVAYTLSGETFPVADVLSSQTQSEDAGPVTLLQLPDLDNNTYKLVIDITRANSSCPYVLDHISFTELVSTPDASQPTSPNTTSTHPSSTRPTSRHFTSTLLSSIALSFSAELSSQSLPAQGHKNHHGGSGGSSSHSQVTVAALAGVLGALAMILLSLCSFFIFRRWRQRRQRERDMLKPVPFDGRTMHAGPSPLFSKFYPLHPQNPC